MLSAKGRRRGHGKYILGSIKVKIPAQPLEIRREDSQVISVYFREYFYKKKKKVFLY